MSSGRRKTPRSLIDFKLAQCKYELDWYFPLCLCILSFFGLTGWFVALIVQLTIMYMIMRRWDVLRRRPEAWLSPLRYFCLLELLVGYVGMRSCVLLLAAWWLYAAVVKYVAHIERNWRRLPQLVIYVPRSVSGLRWLLHLVVAGLFTAYYYVWYATLIARIFCFASCGVWPRIYRERHCCSHDKKPAPRKTRESTEKPWRKSVRRVRRMPWWLARTIKKRKIGKVRQVKTAETVAVEAAVRSVEAPVTGRRVLRIGYLLFVLCAAWLLPLVGSASYNVRLEKPAVDMTRFYFVAAGACLLMFVSKTSRVVLLYAMVPILWQAWTKEVLWYTVSSMGFGELLTFTKLATHLRMSVSDLAQYMFATKLLLSGGVMAIIFYTTLDMLIAGLCRDAVMFFNVDIACYYFRSGFFQALRRRGYLTFMKYLSNKVVVTSIGSRYHYMWDRTIRTTKFCAVCDTFDHEFVRGWFGCASETDGTPADHHLAYFRGGKVRYVAPTDVEELTTRLESKEALIREQRDWISQYRGDVTAAGGLNRLVKTVKEVAADTAVAGTKLGMDPDFVKRLKENALQTLETETAALQRAGSLATRDYVNNNVPQIPRYMLGKFKSEYNMMKHYISYYGNEGFSLAADGVLYVRYGRRDYPLDGRAPLSALQEEEAYTPFLPAATLKTMSDIDTFLRFYTVPRAPVGSLWSVLYLSGLTPYAAYEPPMRKDYYVRILEYGQDSRLPDSWKAKYQEIVSMVTPEDDNSCADEDSQTGVSRQNRGDRYRASRNQSQQRDDRTNGEWPRAQPVGDRPRRQQRHGAVRRQIAMATGFGMMLALALPGAHCALVDGQMSVDALMALAMDDVMNNMAPGEFGNLMMSQITTRIQEAMASRMQEMVMRKLMAASMQMPAAVPDPPVIAAVPDLPVIAEQTDEINQPAFELPKGANLFTSMEDDLDDIGGRAFERPQAPKKESSVEPTPEVEPLAQEESTATPVVVEPPQVAEPAVVVTPSEVADKAVAKEQHPGAIEQQESKLSNPPAVTPAPGKEEPVDEEDDIPVQAAAVPAGHRIVVNFPMSPCRAENRSEYATRICRFKGDCRSCEDDVIWCAHKTLCFYGHMDEIVTNGGLGKDWSMSSTFSPPVWEDRMEELVRTEPTATVERGILIKTSPEHEAVAAVLLRYLHDQRLNAQIVYCTVVREASLVFAVDCPDNIAVPITHDWSPAKHMGILYSYDGFSEVDEIALRLVLSGFSAIEPALMKYGGNIFSHLPEFGYYISGSCSIGNVEAVTCKTDSYNVTRWKAYPISAWRPPGPDPLLAGASQIAGCLPSEIVHPIGWAEDVTRWRCEKIKVEIAVKPTVVVEKAGPHERMSIGRRELSGDEMNAMMGRKIPELRISGEKDWFGQLMSWLPTSSTDEPGVTCRKDYNYKAINAAKDRIILVSDESADAYDFMLCMDKSIVVYDLNKILATPLDKDHHWHFSPGVYYYRETRGSTVPDDGCRIKSTMSASTVAAGIRSCVLNQYPVDEVPSISRMGSGSCNVQNICVGLEPVLSFLMGGLCKQFPTGIVEIELWGMTSTYTEVNGAISYEPDNSRRILSGMWSPDLSRRLVEALQWFDNGLRIVVRCLCDSRLNGANDLVMPYAIHKHGKMVTKPFIVKPGDSIFLKYDGLAPMELSCDYTGIANMTNAVVTVEGDAYRLNFASEVGDVSAYCVSANIVTKFISEHRRVMDISQFARKDGVFMGVLFFYFLTLALVYFRTQPTEERYIKQVIAYALLMVMIYGGNFLAYHFGYVLAANFYVAFFFAEIIACYVWVALADGHSLISQVVAVLMASKNMWLYGPSYLYTWLPMIVSVVRAAYLMLLLQPTLAGWFGYIIVWSRYMLGIALPWQYNHNMTPEIAAMYMSVANDFFECKNQRLAKDYYFKCQDVQKSRRPEFWFAGVATGIKNESSTGSMSQHQPSYWPGLVDCVDVCYAGEDGTRASLIGHVVAPNKIVLNRHIIHPALDWTEVDYQVAIKELPGKALWSVPSPGGVRNRPSFVEMRGMMLVLTFEGDYWNPPQVVETMPFPSTLSNAWLVSRDKLGVRVTPSQVGPQGVLQADTYNGLCGALCYVDYVQDGQVRVAVIGYHNTAIETSFVGVPCRSTVLISAETYTTYYGNIDIQHERINIVVPIALRKLVEAVRIVRPDLLTGAKDYAAWKEVLDTQTDATIYEEAASLRFALTQGKVSAKLLDVLFRQILHGPDKMLINSESRVLELVGYVPTVGLAMSMFVLGSFALVLMFADSWISVLPWAPIVMIFGAGFGSTSMFNDVLHMIWSVFGCMEHLMFMRYAGIVHVVHVLRTFWDYGRTGRFRLILFIAVQLVLGTITIVGRNFSPIFLSLHRYMRGLATVSRWPEFVVKLLVYAMCHYLNIRPYYAMVVGEIAYKGYQLTYNRWYMGKFYIGPHTVFMGKPYLDGNVVKSESDGAMYAVRSKEQNYFLEGLLSNLITACVLLAKHKCIPTSVAVALEDLSKDTSATLDQRLRMIDRIADSLKGQLNIGMDQTDADLYDRLSLMNQAKPDELRLYANLSVLQAIGRAHTYNEAHMGWLAKRMRSYAGPYSTMLNAYKPNAHLTAVLEKLLHKSIADLRRCKTDTLKRLRDALDKEFTDASQVTHLLTLANKLLEDMTGSNLVCVDSDIDEYVVIDDFLRRHAYTENATNEAGIDPALLWQELVAAKQELRSAPDCSAFCRISAGLARAMQVLHTLIHAGCYPVSNQAGDYDLEVLNNELVAARQATLLYEQDHPVATRTGPEQAIYNDLQRRERLARKALNVAQADATREGAAQKRTERIAKLAIAERLKSEQVKEAEERNIQRLATLIARFVHSHNLLKNVTTTDLLTAAEAAKLKGMTPDFYVKFFKPKGPGENLVNMMKLQKPIVDCEVRELNRTVLGQLTFCREIEGGQLTSIVIATSLEPTIPTCTRVKAIYDEGEMIIDPDAIEERLRAKSPGMYLLQYPKMITGGIWTELGVANEADETGEKQPFYEPIAPCGTVMRCDCGKSNIRHNLFLRGCFSSFVTKWKEHLKDCEFCEKFVSRGTHFYCRNKRSRCGSILAEMAGAAAHAHDVMCCIVSMSKCADCLRVMRGDQGPIRVNECVTQLSEAFSASMKVPKQSISVSVKDGSLFATMPGFSGVPVARILASRDVCTPQDMVYDIGNKVVAVNVDWVKAMNMPAHLLANFCANILKRQVVGPTVVNQAKTLCILCNEKFPCSKGHNEYRRGAIVGSPDLLFMCKMIEHKDYINYLRRTHRVDVPCLCKLCLPSEASEDRMNELLGCLMARFRLDEEKAVENQALNVHPLELARPSVNNQSRTQQLLAPVRQVPVQQALTRPSVPQPAVKYNLESLQQRAISRLMTVYPSE